MVPVVSLWIVLLVGVTVVVVVETRGALVLLSIAQHLACLFYRIWVYAVLYKY